MNGRLTTIREYFNGLGLEVELADIYFALCTKGPQTISALTRNSGIERTRIYRLLDKLQSSTLIEVETQHQGKILKAAPIGNLEIMFGRQEQRLAELHRQLPTIEQLLAQNLSSAAGTRIQFYHGPDGAKQIIWNETKAKGEVVSILYENIQIKTAEKYFERWVKRCNERGLRFRGIVGDKFNLSQALWYSTHDNERLVNWESRYIDSQRFNISHSTIVYDDVTAYYSWKDDEIFGIEIYNRDIADTQRDFFEILWEQAAAQPSG